MPIFVQHSIVLKHCQQTGIVWCFETNVQRMHKFVSHQICPIGYIASFRVLDVLPNGHDWIENLDFRAPTISDGIRITSNGPVMSTVVWHSRNQTDLSHHSNMTLYSKQYGLVFCKNNVNPMLTFKVEIVVNDLDYIWNGTNLFIVTGGVHSVALCDNCLEDTIHEVNRCEKYCRINGTRTKRQLVPYRKEHHPQDFDSSLDRYIDRLEVLNPSSNESRSALLALYGLSSVPH
ncbi:hypothetical protein GCK72_023036 [Caenorhabditis remanei]|uniref:RSD-2 N-terminal domain-containing protein n=1 Tax=Caenorhabditis remanei TaxID=31234 RepID=A0A6A5FVY1_CAERE|nr:hypothetical protein GCK72_023036 [Caenorhabditis remanei]KAF1746579.1 hypothetical protein GCK72_023036 [Caenorhabditis remanei]